MWQLILALAIAGSAGWGASRAVTRTTVYEYQHALLFEKGRFVRLLEPGAYWLFRPNSQVQVLDARPKVLTIPGQEVLLKDGVPLKVSVLLGYEVVDARVVVLNYENYQEQLYAAVQTELRRFLSALTLEEILTERNRVSEAIAQTLTAIAEDMGLEVRSAAVKDLMVSGSLKEAFSKVARAKQEGLAALEKARGESAALRHLANAAKMLEKNPQLYQLRLLNSVDGAASVVVHVDGQGEIKQGIQDEETS